MSQHLIPYAGQTAQPHLTPEAKAKQVGWTDERIKVLKALWQDGLSASQIAGELGAPYVSRNAVIAKCHRLGLTGRGQPKSQIARRPRRTLPHRPRPEVFARTVAKPAPTISVTPTKRVEVAAPESKRLTIYKLTNHICHWPYGDAPPYDFCGNLAEEGLPYCEYHAGIAYQTPEPRRRVSAANYR